MAKNDVIVLEQKMIKAKAWLSLNGVAKDVYLIFRTKCQVVKSRGKPGRHGPVILNNGEIIFTYEEAKVMYGISHSRFNRAIDDLVAKGFIDIGQTGMGLHKMATGYAISERWRKYGTSEFVQKERPKAKQFNVGFKPENDLWKLRKTDTTVKNDHGSMRTNDHIDIVAMRTNDHGQMAATLYNHKNGQWLGVKIA